MSFVAFSDPHYDNNYSKSYITDKGISSWLQTQLDITESIFKYAYDNKVEHVIINGDLFEKKNNIGQLLYNTVWGFFKRCLQQYSIEVIFNTGNHDILRVDGSGALKPFSGLFNIIEKPTRIPHKDNVILHFAPFSKYKFYGVPPNNINILFLHEEIGEFIDYPSKKALTGLTSLSLFNTVFNGHIHKPGEYKNIINIGSIIPVDWGESEQDKRFIHYDNGSIKSIPIQHPKFIDVDTINAKVRKFIEKDSYNYYRIAVSAEECGDELFSKYNVTLNIIKTKHRQDRLKDSSSISDEILIWADIKLQNEKIVSKKDVINFMIERINNA